MDGRTRAWVREMKEKYVKPNSRVLDVGSLDVNGNLRDDFPDASEYIGIDMRSGDNVDMVLNAHDLFPYFKEESFDVVICESILEHDKAYWITLDNIYKVLKKGGSLILGVPDVGFVKHDYPKDYWRFSEETLRDILLKRYKIKEIYTLFTEEDENGIPYCPFINVLAIK